MIENLSTSDNGSAYGACFCPATAGGMFGPCAARKQNALCPNMTVGQADVFIDEDGITSMGGSDGNGSLAYAAWWEMTRERNNGGENVYSLFTGIRTDGSIGKVVNYYGGALGHDDLILAHRAGMLPRKGDDFVRLIVG